MCNCTVNNWTSLLWKFNLVTHPHTLSSQLPFQQQQFPFPFIVIRIINRDLPWCPRPWWMSFVTRWCPPGERDTLSGRQETDGRIPILFNLWFGRTRLDCSRWRFLVLNSGIFNSTLGPIFCSYQVAITHSQHVGHVLLLLLLSRDGETLRRFEGCHCAGKEYVSNLYQSHHVDQK